MIARTLVGSSSAVDFSAIEAASSSMNSGLPSAFSTTARASLLTPRDRQQLLGQLAARVLRERVERECGVGGQATAPGRSLREQLGSRERDEEHRHVAHAGSEHLEQVELARVGPVDVLEEEQRREAHRERLDEDARGEEEHVAIGDGAVGVETEEHLEVRRVLLGSRRPCEVGNRSSRASRGLLPARRCRRSSRSASRAVRRRCTACSPRRASSGLGRRARPGRPAAERARGRAGTCRSPPARRP